MATRAGEIGLGNATWLELGLQALQRGDIPAAVGALAAVDETAWQLVMTRFPGLAGWIADISTPPRPTIEPTAHPGSAIAVAVVSGSRSRAAC
ncbi:MAG: hypothetical protein ACJ786_29335 [Catenulispora sp.]